MFINLIEISRLIEKSNSNFQTFVFLSILKLPTIMNEASPFIIIISIAFLYRNLISNNEFISLRNLGLSIIDIFKPIGATILFFGLIFLLILNPISSYSENKFSEITSKKTLDIYSLKFIQSGMWIKNIPSNNEKNYINLENINLNNMKATNIKILKIKNNSNEIILAKNGFIDNKTLILQNVSKLDISENKFNEMDSYKLNLNFTRNNIIDAISHYKNIPFYKYRNHLNNLKKFGLYSSEISLYYLSEFLKPVFLIVIGFVVMGFSSQFKRNENFFKVLFISILIGFLIFLFKEIMMAINEKSKIDFIFSYIIILLLPFILGLYRIIKIEKN